MQLNLQLWFLSHVFWIVLTLQALQALTEHLPSAGGFSGLAGATEMNQPLAGALDQGGLRQVPKK